MPESMDSENETKNPVSFGDVLIKYWYLIPIPLVFIVILILSVFGISTVEFSRMDEIPTESYFIEKGIARCKTCPIDVMGATPECDDRFLVINRPPVYDEQSNCYCPQLPQCVTE